MERFWASSRNKQNLELLIHREAIGQASLLFPENLEILASKISGETGISCHSSINRLSAEVPELNNDLEEADFLIVPHAMHAVKNGIERIVVMSADTDVLILMMYYWNELQSSGLQELWIKSGVGDSTRFIPIHILAARAGNDLCQVLPAVHTITGCDYTSKLGTKHAALKTNPETYLKDFGKITSDLANALSASEEYITHVLKKGTTFKSTDQLRSHMYHQGKRVSFDQLPPTSHATRAHSLRAFFATYQMISLLVAGRESLDPTLYGFEVVEELLVPDAAKHPIPEEFAICCTCSKCTNGRCRCRTEGIPCCRFCKCGSGCKNPFIE